MRSWYKNIDGVHAFYANGLLRSLFMSMTSIYVPLFIYSVGMGIWGSWQAALWLVAAYYILQRLVVVIIVFPLSKLIEQIGFRRSISLSVFFLIAYTVSLLLVKQDTSWLWVSAVCGGLQIPMYWISRDSALSQDIEGKTMGRRIAYIAVLENIASLLGPFVGGTIVALSGYSTLFGVTLAILALSIIPLWWMPGHTHKNGVSLAGFGYFLRTKRYLHQAVANVGIAVNDYGNGVIWPLILFFQGIRDEKIGIIYSVVAVLAVAIQYITGPWFDKLRARKDYADEGIFGLATAGIAIIWVARFFVKGIAQVLPVDMGRQLFSSVHANFFSDYLHLGGKRMDSIAYWVYIEIMYSLGAIGIFGIMAMGVYWGIWKELVLVSIALWSLATLLIAKESNL
ncbi:MAG: Major facilitator superfamily [Microgenomates group bacterium GW2011_GWC1_46_16]|uniref:Major facilitator superfamily (MFS) profile domain-containing protein n=2 Tax=Candidatus Collieribacteriota TaxID=1752725 RepID=A0A1F5FYN4_9BACT|nr:MAG: Major facilitator superfamily [Microgenomates group bacterium GW2011_GWF1_46_12]KKU26763.1 MAG: Major facilitator superfamily [Microgenomates group bacterium GW2011_GWC1_46_16]KKU27997.1 MAG: Major facilitator superfamily [Microgenomates group bacterium GW2011_GWF2_46_18]KKU44232.1 MAG: Major facilitator superfamily [Microgenomates group bacterium GW2011_GWA1_46_7]KKU45671.1 MAG: Major facilitator superfamily [Microgenomates group bacterium GW2011_GWB1_46_7]KKU61334.1 MAG: Major facili